MPSLAKIGFTGTQRGMTTAQMVALHDYLCERIGEFHHGDCVGADAQAHKIAGAIGYDIIGHPPSNPIKRAWCECVELKPEKPYLDRNKDIVLQTTMLIAVPSEMQEQLRSGTWSTVRYARRLDKAITVILPNGVLCPSS